jgi:hypothetical protein
LPHFVGANTSVSVQRVWRKIGGADLGGGATLATHGDAGKSVPAAPAATRLARLRWSRLWLAQPPRGDVPPRAVC